MLDIIQILIILFLIIAIAIAVHVIRRMMVLEKRIVHIDENIERMLKHVSKKHRKLEEEIDKLG